ncbi:EFR1 family ferrodoxin [Selenomonas ruminantium]|uniref:EFR1 family ferrodoxin n=1 Tax=Selenomonas ruminantium TaxID=971 RepID=UPI001567E27A|nr:EFR1 family ferrodoxin [Selenomonas ruminantium]
MIVYFSATGTNKYVAQELTKTTGEEMIPLKELVRQGKYRLTVPDGENFGVVMPTYWEGLPSILLDYLEQAEIELLGSNHYCYFVATYGCDYGNILSTAQKEFGRIGIHFDSLYAARFVDNWSPMFYLKDKERNRQAEENGEAETKRIVQQVMNKEVGHTLPNQMSALGAAAAKTHFTTAASPVMIHSKEKAAVILGGCHGIQKNEWSDIYPHE